VRARSRLEQRTVQVVSLQRRGRLTVGEVEAVRHVEVIGAVRRIELRLGLPGCVQRVAQLGRPRRRARASHRQRLIEQSREPLEVELRDLELHAMAAREPGREPVRAAAKSAFEQRV
jgi:hypothetical protein